METLDGLGKRRTIVNYEEGFPTSLRLDFLMIVGGKCNLQNCGKHLEKGVGGQTGLLEPLMSLG